MLLLVGIEEADGEEDIEWLAGKVARMRIFDDETGVMNLDVVQTDGEVLAVSQFTLHASTRKGNRPSYIRSARPDISKPLYEKFVARLSRELGREVQTGVFGADMRVALTNNGPVTIWLDSKNRE
jgi:D-tyrosyl-tRNA(Tyr) deacylase